MAASLAAVMRVTRFPTTGASVGPSGAGFIFLTDIANIGTAPSTQLIATVSVTVVNANQWGTNPTATLSGADSQAAWTFVGVSGSGLTRVFTFDAQTEAPITAGNFKAFDLVVQPGTGAAASGLNPSTFTVTAIPGGSGVPGMLTRTYAGVAGPGRPGNAGQQLSRA